LGAAKGVRFMIAGKLIYPLGLDFYFLITAQITFLLSTLPRTFKTKAIEFASN
jgi:hypothetical protein